MTGIMNLFGGNEQVFTSNTFDPKVMDNFGNGLTRIFSNQSPNQIITPIKLNTKENLIKNENKINMTIKKKT